MMELDLIDYCVRAQQPATRSLTGKTKLSASLTGSNARVVLKYNLQGQLIISVSEPGVASCVLYTIIQPFRLGRRRVRSYTSRVDGSGVNDSRVSLTTWEGNRLTPREQASRAADYSCDFSNLSLEIKLFIQSSKVQCKHMFEFRCFSFQNIM